MSRSCWIDRDQNPDDRKQQAYGIDCWYFDALWLAGKGSGALQYLRQVKTPRVGVYFCDPHQWLGTAPTDPKAWADWASQTLQKTIAPGTAGDWPRVDLNIEMDDPAWLLAALKRWRWHQPHRTTAWNVQNHKADLYAGVAADIAKLNIKVKPECFGGNMTRVESSGEILSWENVGIPPHLLEPMLDGSQLGMWWEHEDLTIFTMGRLP